MALSWAAVVWVGGLCVTVYIHLGQGNQWPLSNRVKGAPRILSPVAVDPLLVRVFGPQVGSDLEGPALKSLKL